MKDLFTAKRPQLISIFPQQREWNVPFAFVSLRVCHFCLFSSVPRRTTDTQGSSRTRPVERSFCNGGCNLRRRKIMPLRFCVTGHLHLISIHAVTPVESRCHPCRTRMGKRNAKNSNKCGCRNVRCCEETGHKRSECAQPVSTKFWTFRWNTTVSGAESTNGVW